MKKSLAIIGSAAALGFVAISAAPASAYSSTNFYNRPSSCWGNVTWGGSSYHDGYSTAIAATSESNNPCYVTQVRSVVRYGSIIVGSPKYGYNYVTATYSGMNVTSDWSYGGSHGFGDASGAS